MKIKNIEFLYDKKFYYIENKNCIYTIKYKNNESCYIRWYDNSEEDYVIYYNTEILNNFNSGIWVLSIIDKIIEKI